ncbi:hypothetical protein HDU96_005242 [Phlyctochytrium bullatum]|nr:hypothetical protein HDU96_005242 [Phlyctochytrium bullatum]
MRNELGKIGDNAGDSSELVDEGEEKSAGAFISRGPGSGKPSRVLYVVGAGALTRGELNGLLLDYDGRAYFRDIQSATAAMKDLLLTTALHVCYSNVLDRSDDEPSTDASVRSQKSEKRRGNTGPAEVSPSRKNQSAEVKIDGLEQEASCDAGADTAPNNTPEGEEGEDERASNIRGSGKLRGRGRRSSSTQGRFFGRATRGTSSGRKKGRPRSASVDGSKGKTLEAGIDALGGKEENEVLEEGKEVSDEPQA